MQKKIKIKSRKKTGEKQKRINKPNGFLVIVGSQMNHWQRISNTSYIENRYVYFSH